MGAGSMDTIDSSFPERFPRFNSAEFLFGIQRRPRFILTVRGGRIIGPGRPGNAARTGGVGWQPGEFCKKLIHHLPFNNKRTSGALNSQSGRTRVGGTRIFCSASVSAKEGRTKRERERERERGIEGLKKVGREVEGCINCSYLGPPPIHRPPHRQRYRICN